MTDRATNIKTKLKLFINNIDELGGTFVTYRALLIKDLLQLTLNLVQDKEQECEELKEHLNQAKYLTEGALRLYSERQNIKYKQALDEIEQTINNFPSEGIKNIPQTQIECTQHFLSVSEAKLQKILGIINKAKEKQ